MRPTTRAILLVVTSPHVSSSRSTHWRFAKRCQDAIPVWDTPATIWSPSRWSSGGTSRDANKRTSGAKYLVEIWNHAPWPAERLIQAR